MFCCRSKRREGKSEQNAVRRSSKRKTEKNLSCLAIRNSSVNPMKFLLQWEYGHVSQTRVGKEKTGGKVVPASTDALRGTSECWPGGEAAKVREGKEELIFTWQESSTKVLTNCTPQSWEKGITPEGEKRKPRLSDIAGPKSRDQ